MGYIHLLESAIRDFSMGSAHGMARWLRAVGSLPLSRKRPMCLHILAPTGLQVKAGGAVSGATTGPVCSAGLQGPVGCISFLAGIDASVDDFRLVHRTRTV